MDADVRSQDCLVGVVLICIITLLCHDIASESRLILQDSDSHYFFFIHSLLYLPGWLYLVRIFACSDVCNFLHVCLRPPCLLSGLTVQIPHMEMESKYSHFIDLNYLSINPYNFFSNILE